MEHRNHTSPFEYEKALAQERQLWNELDQPFAEVNEQVKACARWSAAAERARAIGERMHQSTTYTQSR